jgi:hypothetical protein
MDSTVATDFSLITGGATQTASHLQAASDGVFPPQQQPSLAEHVSDSSSQVSTVPLHLMGTHTPAIISLSNTHEVILLKFINTNTYKSEPFIKHPCSKIMQILSNLFFHLYIYNLLGFN